MLVGRLGAQRDGAGNPLRTYLAICEYGETHLSLRAESDREALSEMRLAFPDCPLVCDEATLADAARPLGLEVVTPGEFQRFELAVQSAHEDLGYRGCRVPYRVYREYLLSSIFFLETEALADPRLDRRFFLLTRDSGGKAQQYSLFVRPSERDGELPSFILRAPEERSPEGRPKFTTRFESPAAWTAALLRSAFDVDWLAVPGRGRDGRGVSPTELNLLTATHWALTEWLVQRRPLGVAGRVRVSLEEHPLSRLANLGPSVIAS